jgi:hypothetical protein
VKRLVGLITVLWLAVSVSLVFAESRHGSRYNPYSPNRSEGSREQVPAKEMGSYDPDKGADPTTTDPRRWYDSQENYQKSYEQTVNDPKTLSNPYRGIRPYPSGELTSPYEGVIPQSPDSSNTKRQLTPPTQK